MDAAYATEIADRLRKLETVNAASLRAVRRDVSKQVASAPAREVIKLALRIVEEAPPGAYPFAYELIYYHPTALSSMKLDDLERYGRHMSGWGEVDSFAGVAGVAWRNGQISDAAIRRWARSSNRWWRRAALVSTVPLNVKSHGGQGDAKRTLAVCSLLLGDRDDMVVKAMSWALRALAVREPEAVADFVSRNEDVLASRAVREVRNKLRTGRKDGRR
jgi:3-methyladenine DNA glycosylase AlkD